MVNMVTAAGSVAAFNGLSPKFADLSIGNAYTVILANQTNADVTTGTFTIEGANAKADDPCAPDTWAPIEAMPHCDALPGAVPAPATITLSAQAPVKANSQCSFAVECPNQFIRVDGGTTTLDVIIVLTRLKRVVF